MKEIEFFKNLVKTRIFTHWKCYIKQSRKNLLLASIGPKIREIYNPRLLQIRSLLFGIRTQKIMDTTERMATALDKYSEFLYNRFSRYLACLQTESLSGVLRSVFEELEGQISSEKEKLAASNHEFDEGVNIERVKNKFKLSMLSKEPSQTKGKLNLNNLQSMFLTCYRKVNYLVSDLGLQIFEDLIQ